MNAQAALDSLLGRLTAVLVNEAQLLGGIRSDVEFIKDEMESMSGLLQHLTEAQHRDHQVRAWMKQVAGLARDRGGNVELYIHYVGGTPGGSGRLLLLRRIPRFLRTISVRHRIATRIRELKTRACDISDRRLRYGVTVPPSQPDEYRAAIDLPDRPAEEEECLRRRDLLHGEPAYTVEEGSSVILGWLSEEASWYPRWPRVIGIERSGTVGTTSIARRVYGRSYEVSSFQLRAWVSFGGLRKGIDEACREILEQTLLPPTMPPSSTKTQEMSETPDGVSLLDKVRERLAGKRIMIVLDNVPQVHPDVQLLIDGLTQSDCISGSAIIATTPEWKIGYSDETYKILNVYLFRLDLLGRRVSELAGCDVPIASRILEYCSLDEFALLMFLRLIYASPNRSHKEMCSLRDDLDNHGGITAQVMLTFCYRDLPSSYKSCFLYLSIFPQDHIIRRTTLLRRWVAEGLITDRRNLRAKGPHRMSTLDDQAEFIFDALVIRGFIRPEETSAVGRIKSFTVPKVVHRFLVGDLSFVGTYLPPDLAYRFPANNGIELREASHHDRPFDGILTILEFLPESNQWQLLRVLDLEGCTGLDKKHLKTICKILLLKYLSLRNSDVTELPKEIEKLQCLNTLNIRKTAIRALSIKSVMLPMLKHLLAGRTINTSNSSSRLEESFETVCLPSGIRRMKELEILSHVEVSRNVDDLIDIGQLLQLRKLGVVLNGKKDGLRLLFQQIEKLHACLRSLSIRINQPIRSESAADAEVIAALVTPPKLLESLNISGITSGLPQWISELHLLAKVTLKETFLGEDAIHMLGNLRMLRCLRLLNKSYTKNRLNFKVEEFQCLKSLVIDGSDITNISFYNGAAPKLQLITWSFGTLGALSLSGIDNLTRLKKLQLDGETSLDTAREVIKKHPNNADLKHNPHHQRQEDGTAETASSSSAS